MIRDLLPIGSIVRLKNTGKKLMIFGIKQLDTKNPEVEFDYIGVLYPEGNIGSNFNYLFNHEDIEEVVYKGYEDEDFHKFIDTVAKAYGE